MKIIKLDAIDSTNSFLKEMAQNTVLENYTIVTALKQEKGRGQMGTSWVSEPNKNLLCSVFVSFNDFSVQKQVLINYAVSIAIIKTLEYYKLPKLAIKWPNDILSLNHKLCGILVENTIQNSEVKYAIIGIGLNVNQIKFSESLSKVTSMKLLLAKEIDLDEVLLKLVDELKEAIAFISNEKTDLLKKTYLKFLYKKNSATMFKDNRNVLFMGIIVGVSSAGKLQIQIEDDSVKEFGIKEISFI